MKLEKLRLVNICQHQDTAVEFGYGVTGVFGPNGCGKSNLLKMAKVSLTGDFGVNEGLKADNVRHGAGKEPAYVEATWTHDGVSFDVVRGLQGKDTTLSVHGTTEAYRGAGDVSAAVERIVGLSKQVIDGFIFVDQWKMFEFMSARPADRAKTFAHLCNTFAAEKLWSLLGQTAAKVHVQDCTEELATTQTELSEAAKQLKTCSTELEDVKAVLLSSQEQKELSALVADWNRQVELHKSIKEKQATKAAIKEELTTAESELARWQSVFDAQEQRAAEFDRAFNTLCNGYDDYLRNLRVQQSIDAVNAERKALRKPKAPACLDSMAELREALQRKQYESNVAAMEKKAAERLVKLLETPGIQRCPTCDSELSNAKDENIAKQKQRIADSDEIIATCKKESVVLERKLSEIDTYHEEAAEYERNKKAKQERLELLRAQLDASWTPSDDYAAAAQKAQAQKEEADKELAVIRKSLNKAQQVLADKRAALRVVLDLLKELKARFETVSSVTKEEAEAAERVLNAQNENARKSAVLFERQSNLRERHSELKQRLQKLNEQIKSNEKLVVWRNDLERWKQVVHRDNLPRLMANSLLEQLVVVVNQNLDDFANPFTVTASDDLSLVVNKPHGRREVASRLSGGEKILLAVAFRLAVNSVFANNAGMMVLDEPSAGLDAHNIECLADTIERISIAATARQQQIIIVTHDDDRLSRVIPTAVNLPAVIAKK
jgi:exonuclease SbcC